MLGQPGQVCRWKCLLDADIKKTGHSGGLKSTSDERKSRIMMFPFGDLVLYLNATVRRESKGKINIQLRGFRDVFLKLKRPKLGTMIACRPA